MSNVYRTVEPTMVGTNLAWWQGELGTARMTGMITDARLGLLRLPGGSSSNSADRHFDLPAPWNGYKASKLLAEAVDLLFP